MEERSTLVVGKHSRLFGAIRPLLKPHAAISHTEVASTDLGPYRDIFVFSWDFRSLQANLELLGRLPGERTILISTTAVYALQLRPQWNVYPNAKAAAEARVLSAGGKVIRVGITSRSLLDRLRGAVPFTAIDRLAALVNEWDGTQQAVTDLVELERGRLSGPGRFLATCLGALSEALPARAIVQAPLQAVAKVLGVRHIGYTGDMLKFFADELLVGYGALGSCYDRARPDPDRTLLVSGRPSRTLEQDGFVNTVIGLDRIGLAALWHGVDLTRSPLHAGKATKKVPLLVRRPRPPGRRTAVAHVGRIEFQPDQRRWRVHATTSDGRRQTFFAGRLVLAAGPIENARLLMDEAVPLARFSDHEIAMIGTCSTRSAEAARGVRKVGPFVLRGLAHVHDGPGRPFVVEFRPAVPRKHGTAARDARFYLTSTGGVLKRLVRDASPSRLNEALYNKLGLGIDTGTCSVFVQALCRDAIRLQRTGPSALTLSRSRMDPADWAEVAAQARELAPDLVPDAEIVSVDGQHLMGGAALLEARGTRQLVTDGYLLILGSPTVRELSALHHTPSMQREVVRRARGPGGPLAGGRGRPTEGTEGAGSR